jgi:hypothetical protein
MVAKHHEMVVKDRELPPPILLPLPVLRRAPQVAEAPLPDIAAWAAEIEADSRRRLKELAAIEEASFRHLVDRVFFGHQGKGLDWMRETGVQGLSFAMRDLILTWPNHTAHVGALAIGELDRLVPTDDQIYNAAVRRLQTLIQFPYQEETKQWLR